MSVEQFLELVLAGAKKGRFSARLPTSRKYISSFFRPHAKRAEVNLFEPGLIGKFSRMVSGFGPCTKRGGRRRFLTVFSKTLSMWG